MAMRLCPSCTPFNQLGADQSHLWSNPQHVKDLQLFWCKTSPAKDGPVHPDCEHCFQNWQIRWKICLDTLSIINEEPLTGWGAFLLTEWSGPLCLSCPTNVCDRHTHIMFGSAFFITTHTFLDSKGFVPLITDLSQQPSSQGKSHTFGLLGHELSCF